MDVVIKITPLVKGFLVAVKDGRRFAADKFCNDLLEVHAFLDVVLKIANDAGEEALAA